MRTGPLVLVSGLSLVGCAREVGHPDGVIREVTERGRPGVQLNAWRDGDGMIYRLGARCVVFPDDGAQRPVGAMPPAMDLPCPPTMRDDAWSACGGGTLTTTEDPLVCTCAVSGNPPPPPTRTPCPK